MTDSTSQNVPKQENPLLNIVFNIALPIFILNKGGAYLGAVQALLLALTFPLAYGAYDLWRTRRPNFISILGLLNVTVSGCFSLMQFEGLWFAVKEAFFPLLIGIFVFGSAFGSKPFLQTMFLNPQVINLHLVEEALNARGEHSRFKKLIRQSTIYLSGSFLLSAILNFILAYSIFKPLDHSTSAEERQNVLNGQLGEMTKLSFVVILVPSLISLGLILWHFLSQLGAMTGLAKEQILAAEPTKSSTPQD